MSLQSFSSAFAVLCLASVATTTTAATIGSDPVSAGSLDGWNSNMSVQEGHSYTNTSGGPEIIELETFSFYVGDNRGRVTPFVVRLDDTNGNGNTSDDNHFTVLKIGTTRVSGIDYASVGAVTTDFKNGGESFTLGDGDTIAPGMLDSNPDRSGGAGSVIPFSGNVTAGEQWYNGDSALGGGSTITEGGTLSGTPVAGVENRNYQFNIGFSVAPFGPLPPTNITLANEAAIFPTSPPGTKVGDLTSTDPNPADTHSYTLVTNSGGVFTISGSELRLATAPGAGGTEHVVRLRSTDSGDLSFEKDFAITVQTPQPPTDLSLSSTSITTSHPTGALVGQLATTDATPNDHHTYLLVAGAGDADNGLFTISGDELRLASAVPTDRTSLSLRLRSTDGGGLSIEKSFTLPVTDPSVRLNEFVASNAGSLTDEDAEESDWIELFNEQGAATDLAGWFLTDDPDNLTKWQFPSVSIPASGHLIVFASGKDRAVPGSQLHTNFQLTGGGEFLALVKPDGSSIADQYSFGQQFPDIAFGYSGTGGGSQGFLTPTPGASNGPAFEFGLNEVTFSHTRGHYSNDFNLTLGALAPGSVIRYTTNGSKPTSNSGTVYSGPIPISPSTTGDTRGTRIVRAIAVNADAAVAKVATHTYLFVNGVSNPSTDGIVNQSNLNNSIRSHATYGPLLDDALLALPTVSVTGGLPGSTESERSIEFFVPGNTEPGFQLDAGMKVVGGHSVSSPKNNFRIYIRGDYGQSKLGYPLFAGHPYSSGATEVFNRLNLRSGSHDSFFWLANSGNPPNSGGPQKGDAQYIRNRWINDMQFAMGHESQHGRFVQLYVNGEYRGQYQLHEWPNHDFTASYLGGDSSQYEFTNGASTSKSGSDNWQSIWGTMKSSANSSFAAAKQWIDLENLADYMLLNFYAGNPWDWNPNQNWMASGPNTAGQNGWIFHGWDSDICLQDPNANVLAKNVPDGVFAALMNHEDFRVLFRDRVYQHCFNDGVLTPAEVAQIHTFRAEQIRTSIVAETARWQGGGATSAPWDRDGEWQAELDRMANFFTVRTDILLDQLRARSNWFPLEAPEFDTRGGTVDAGHTPVLSAGTGTIYFTTDGSDPRLEGGAVNPSATALSGNVSDQLIPAGATWKYLSDGSNQGTAWRSTGFADTAWPAGPAELGYGEGDEATDVGFVDTDPGTIGNQRNITTYFRHHFNVTGASSYTSLHVELKRDDGAVVYLNGQEIARSSTMPAGAIDYQTTSASASDDGNNFHPFDLGGGQFTLVEGNNVLAVELHQSGPNSSDTSFDLSLSGTRPAGGSNLVINSATVVSARVFDGSTWSALNEASFVLTGTEPADASNTTLTEINYNPQGDDSFEFLEFKNTSVSPVDFSGTKLSGAVSYEFPLGSVVPAGGYILVVEDTTEFATRYSDSNSPWFYGGIAVAGAWSGNLSNSGEPITFDNVTGGPIFSFSYSDSGAWPGRADGNGSSAELEAPGSVPTTTGANDPYLSEGKNWRPSSEFNGSPGRAGSGPDNRVVINEVLAHTDLPQTDQLELFNQSGAPIAIGGWFLSDSSSNYAKYQIPSGTTMPTGGFLTFDESHFNNPANPDNPSPFAFSSSSGDDVYLLEADSSGNLLRFVDRVSFGASRNGESFGRWPDGTGDLYPMGATTFGAANATVRTGPVVVTEIHYNPDGPDEDVEFIQICNPGTISESLDNWRLRGEVDFDFPSGLSLAPGGTLLLVGFDPADTARRDAFLLRYALAPATPIHGAWNDGGAIPAKLDDGGGAIRLQRPDDLVTPTDGSPAFYPMLVEDTVNYNDSSPWPTAPDGTGASLQRIDVSSYGDNPTNWQSSATPLGQSFDDWVTGAFPGGTPASQLILTADPDNDSLTNFAEYAFDLDPTRSQATQAVRVEAAPDNSELTISYRARPAAHGISYSVATSTDLVNWSSHAADLIPVSSTIQPDGSRLVIVKLAPAGGLSPTLFVRIELASND